MIIQGISKSRNSFEIRSKYLGRWADEWAFCDEYRSGLSSHGNWMVLKSEGKFQDIGSIRAGVVEGIGSLTVAFVKLGKKFSFKRDMALALVQTHRKTGPEFLSGAVLSKGAHSEDLKMFDPKG